MSVVKSLFSAFFIGFCALTGTAGAETKLADKSAMISVEAFGVINNDSEFLPELVAQIFPEFELRIYTYYDQRRFIKITVWDGEKLIAEFGNAQFGGFADVFYYGSEFKDQFGGHVGMLVKDFPKGTRDYCYVSDMKMAIIFCYGDKSSRIQYWIDGNRVKNEKALLMNPKSKIFAIRWYTTVRGAPPE